MNPALKGIWNNMQALGLGALAHANRHAAYAAWENDRWPYLAVLQAAHAAELLVKARIAQEHPLLIFDRLPKASEGSGGSLDLDDLFQKGRTVQWNDLPDRLWAATGISLDRQAFEVFGKLRNAIQHFAQPPTVDPGGDALRFIFSVVDPFINECWALYAVDYDEDHEPYVYFISALVSREIPFLVSTSAAASFSDWDVNWEKVNASYSALISDRVAAAKSAAEQAN